MTLLTLLLCRYYPLCYVIIISGTIGIYYLYPRRTGCFNQSPPDVIRRPIRYESTCYEKNIIGMTSQLWRYNYDVTPMTSRLCHHDYAVTTMPSQLWTKLNNITSLNFFIWRHQPFYYDFTNPFTMVSISLLLWRHQPVYYDVTIMTSLSLLLWF